MSQHDMEITKTDANTGVTFRSQVNAALQALATRSSGATEPTVKYPYMPWADITSGYMKIRNDANNAWIIQYRLSDMALSLPIIGGSINNTPIGATTPSTGAFTTLSVAPTVANTGISLAQQIGARTLGISVHNDNYARIFTDGTSPLAINQFGGNVLIGTTTDTGSTVRLQSPNFEARASGSDSFQHSYYFGGTIGAANIQLGAAADQLDFWTYAGGWGRRMRLSSAGLTVASLAGTGNRAVYSDASGLLTNSSSDSSLKTNVVQITSGLSQVQALRPVSFNWVSTSRFGTQREIGFIAQEVREVIPEVIGVNYDGTLSLDYPKLTATLVAAIQELTQRIKTLEGA